jgi:sarcosine oxidase/L-pipecolate oxidase
MVYHEGVKKDISVPPSNMSQMTFSQDVPEGLKQEVANVVANTYGKYIKGLKIESYRMCW